MKNLLASLDKDLEKILREIGWLADKRSTAAYVVGGFVRDLLLNKTQHININSSTAGDAVRREWEDPHQADGPTNGSPRQNPLVRNVPDKSLQKNLDVDIVVEEDALGFAEDFAQRKQVIMTRYPQFKTATVILKSGRRIDFATARKETYPHSGALPVVAFGSIKNDLFRRDFTINAMAIKINRKTFGELVDLYNGFQDLKEKKVRVLHEKSFIDDPTRILRAVRFEQRLDFKIEPKTLGLFRRALKKKVILHLKPPRYFEEFRKIFDEPKPSKSIKRLNNLKAFNFFWNIPSSKALLAVKQMEKIEVLFQKSINSPESINRWLVYFMALAEKIPLSDLTRLLKSFHSRTTDSAKVLTVAVLPSIHEFLNKKKRRPYEVYAELHPLSTEAIVFFAATTVSATTKKYIKDYFERYQSAALEINGHDLKLIGIESGKYTGEILKQVLYQKLDGLLHGKQDELKAASQQWQVIKRKEVGHGKN